MFQKSLKIAGSLLFATPLILAAAPLQARQNLNVQGSENSQAALSGSKETATASDKKICKRLETTGSRMNKRACHTADEWKKIEDGTED